MISIELYSKNDCSLCVRAKETILRVQQTIPFTFSEILLVPGTDIEREFRHDIPVLRVNGRFHSRHSISETDLLHDLMKLRSIERTGQ